MKKPHAKHDSGSEVLDSGVNRNTVETVREPRAVVIPEAQLRHGQTCHKFTNPISGWWFIDSQGYSGPMVSNHIKAEMIVNALAKAESEVDKG